MFPPPPLSRLVDFSRFWSRTVKELDRTLPMVERKAAATRAGIRLEWLSFASLGDARISGYLLRWADGAPRPLVVHGPGYGGRTTPRWRWARAGLNVVGVDVRGWGRSRAALASPSRWGGS